MIVGITCGGFRLVDRIAAALDAGIDRVLVREGTLPPIEALARGFPGRIVLHTRMPGARECAERLPVGLHFSSTTFSPTGAPWSRSTHSIAEARAAIEAGAAWVLLSPIWRSPSKPGDDRPPLGVEVLGVVPGAVALGGVNAARVGECRAAGAFGVAGMGGIFGVEDAGAAVRQWRTAWETAPQNDQTDSS